MLETLLTIYMLSRLQPQSMAFLPQFGHAAAIETQAPQKSPEYIAPVLSSKAVLAIDLDSHTVLYQKNAQEKLPVASLTKLMTAYIISKENTMDEVATVSSKAVNILGSKVWLYPQEKITVGNLMHGLLIKSGNDTAIALAEHNAETLSAFVGKMNFYAKELGMKNTHFTNPIGLDNPNNYSTAFDMAILSREVLKEETITNIVNKQTFTITSEDGTLKHDLESTNDLLQSYLPMKGLKTGRTQAAGECFIGLVDTEDTDERRHGEVLTIIIGSSDRFQETKILLDWIFRAYEWPTQ